MHAAAPCDVLDFMPLDLPAPATLAGAPPIGPPPGPADSIGTSHGPSHGPQRVYEGWEAHGSHTAHGRRTDLGLVLVYYGVNGEKHNRYYMPAWRKMRSASYRRRGLEIGTRPPWIHQKH
ncbi:tRNA (guanine(37)-N1)-methyltransferase 2-like [Dorcoceras hygrometricum]|uniref:tRNA (Guanine(37)-N1)-methyltransferase 2-like n=1 Tax=Dorcoceras hygrometricum TaxID=472368 RepID=A0A2Z7B323_9LAMI|nr:tRNA (guanine(37)-N1)-methyltransferase 2-like [Dorcoceras hygrometricum]